MSGLTIDRISELVALARRVAAHFENTDAPLGVEAAAILAKIDGTRSSDQPVPPDAEQPR